MWPTFPSKAEWEDETELLGLTGRGFLSAQFIGSEEVAEEPGDSIHNSRAL